MLNASMPMAGSMFCLEACILGITKLPTTMLMDWIAKNIVAACQMVGNCTCK